MFFMFPYPNPGLFCLFCNQLLIWLCAISTDLFAEFSFVILEGSVLFEILLSSFLLSFEFYFLNIFWCISPSYILWLCCFFFLFFFLCSRKRHIARFFLFWWLILQFESVQPVIVCFYYNMTLITWCVKKTCPQSKNYQWRKSNYIATW